MLQVCHDETPRAALLLPLRSRGRLGGGAFDFDAKSDPFPVLPCFAGEGEHLAYLYPRSSLIRSYAALISLARDSA